MQSYGMELKKRWAELNIKELVSERVQNLSSGSATDWGIIGSPPNPQIPLISLGGGIPDESTLPRDGLSNAMTCALGLVTKSDNQHPSTWVSSLSYGGSHGYNLLRDEVAKFFARDYSPAIDGSYFVLTNGAAGAIDLACTAIIDPGDIVVTEVPAFSGTLRTIRGHSAKIVGVTMDTEGMRIDELEDTLNRLKSTNTPAKLIYVSPSFHNPTGITMTVKRRIELLQVASRYDVLILEDTAYNELYFGEQLHPTIGALSQGRFVITAGTFSKVIAPGLRVGWLQACPELIETIMPVRFDMGNSPLLHRMIYEFMAAGELAIHLAKMRTIYHSKMIVLAQALRRYCKEKIKFTEPSGGFFLWLQITGSLSAREVQVLALDQNVSFPIGSSFYPSEGPQSKHQFLRLAYSRATIKELQTAAKRLASCFNKT